MLIRSFSLFLAVLATPVMAKTVVVGNCRPFLQSYLTVTQAIESVPADSTILVCPGDYPEQIVIRQPLTLKGVKDGNAANP
jgi:pectin methylesterase-like acyl-CoA thioesterase